MVYRPSDWSALGYGSDPIPGDPEVVRAGGQHYVNTADSMHNAAATLRALNTGASSGSKSVEALKKDCAQVLSDVEKAENRYREAGNALIDYAYVQDATQAITLQALIAARNALEAGTAARRSAVTYERLALDAHGLQDTEEQTRCTRLAASYRSDAAECDAQVAAQRQIAAQAVADHEAAANRAMERIRQATSQDGLKDSWWDDWGAKITAIIADVAQWVATIAGVLAMLLCWVPVLGQALLAIAAIAGIVAAVANILLAATGERSWTEALISIGFAVLGCVGLGGLKGVLGALRAGAGFVRGGGLAALGARGLVSGTVKVLSDGIKLMGTKAAIRLVPSMRAMTGKTSLGYHISDWKLLERLKFNVKTLRPKEGYHDVFAHGSPDSVLGEFGETLNATQLADIIRSGSWDGVEAIRLVSCETGAGPFAQELADALGVRVLAPLHEVWSSGSGKTLQDGWRKIAEMVERIPQ